MLLCRTVKKKKFAPDVKRSEDYCTWVFLVAIVIIYNP